jgi:hypothetical protein
MRPPKPTRPADLECPGLKWRERSGGWVAYWVARADIRDRGWPIATRKMHAGATPTREEWEFMADECGKLQDEMLAWGGGERGRDDATSIYDGTWFTLIDVYMTDPDSRYQEVRHGTQMVYGARCRRLQREIGRDLKVGETSLRTFKGWHKRFAEGGTDTLAYDLMNQVRLIVSFGKALRLAGVAEVASILEEITFKGPRRGKGFMTAEQCTTIRETARRLRYPSIAISQALQFELGVRQRDAIGEWIPLGRPGLSDVIKGNSKWVMGFRWESVDARMVLRHRISKTVRGAAAVANQDDGEWVDFPLLAYPMVCEELRLIAGVEPGAVITRDMFPASGPMIVAERTRLPWRGVRFSTAWRVVATAAGFDHKLKSSLSRAGSLTEARKAGATIEDMRHHAVHRDIKTTAIYDRSDVEDREKFARRREEHRKNKTGERSGMGD